MLTNTDRPEESDYDTSDSLIISKKDLQERIDYLKGVEIDYFNKTYNNDLSHLKLLNSNMSKEFNARRSELERLMKDNT